MFDECYTKEGAEVLAQFLQLYNPPIHSDFLVTFLQGKRGERDENWPHLIKDDPEWVVVSFDRGSSGQVKAKGEPLHIVLPRLKITGVYLSGTLAQATRFDKIRAVMAALPQIFAECGHAPRGSRFKINRHTVAESGAQHFNFSEWPVKPRERQRFS